MEAKFVLYQKAGSLTSSVIRYAARHDETEEQSVHYLYSLLMVFQVVTTMVVIVAATPITAAFMVPIMCLYYFIQQVFVTTSRQLMRIESVSKSPIYSHFSETIQGKLNIFVPLLPLLI